MIILLDNPKRGDKITITREYEFGKGEYTEVRTIVVVWNGIITLDDGYKFRYYEKR